MKILNSLQIPQIIYNSHDAISLQERFKMLNQLLECGKCLLVCLKPSLMPVDSIPYSIIRKHH